MPDIYATIDRADAAVQHQLADVLELRARDPRQQAMLEDYLADAALSGRVLEIGCGTGAITRRLAREGDAIGIDPSPVFIARARELAPEIRFEVADGRELPFADGSFDAVVCHTALCHIPECERVLAEAHRVSEKLVIFEGDYATTTVALSDHDPLQACVEAAVAALVHDRWVVRRLPALLEAAGWEPVRMRSHGYVESGEPGYMLTIVDRGAEFVPGAMADALRAEARRRADDGSWFGHIAYASVIARR